jgi:hypothetical protein
MYLGNDLPLIIKYNVASLGEIWLCPPSGVIITKLLNCVIMVVRDTLE